MMKQIAEQQTQINEVTYFRNLIGKKIHIKTILNEPIIGVLISYDNYNLFIEENSKLKLVRKEAIVTVEVM